MITEEQKQRIEEEAKAYSETIAINYEYHIISQGQLRLYAKKDFIKGYEFANQELKAIEKHNADLLERIKGDEKTIELRDERIKELEKQVLTVCSDNIQLVEDRDHWKALPEKADKVITSLKKYRTESMAPKEELALITEYESLKTKSNKQ